MELQFGNSKKIQDCLELYLIFTKMYIASRNEVIDIKSIYLDHAATTPLSSEMKKYILSLLDEFGNPSSNHTKGHYPKQIITDTRKVVASFINADSKNIYFTPSGSASNTLAIHGFYSKNICHVLYSPISHKSILKCVEHYEYASPLKVDSSGFIDIKSLEAWMNKEYIQPFVVIDYANSEIGTIQDVKKIIDIVHAHNGIVYLDCTGSIPTIPLDVKYLNVDMCGFSAHKLGALKGCGVLYKRPGIALEPLVYGIQEQGLIGGTENVLGIASLGRAVENHNYSLITSKSRDYVYEKIISNVPNCYLLGASTNSANRLAHNLYMCFKGIEGESLMLLLDSNNIQVSTGSACSSGNITPSPALSAIGIDSKDIHSCIRMTFSGHETTEDLDYACVKIIEYVEVLRKMNVNSFI